GGLERIGELAQAPEVLRVGRAERADAERDAMKHERPLAPHRLEHRARAATAAEEVLADDLDPVDLERASQRAGVVGHAQPHAVAQERVGAGVRQARAQALEVAALEVAAPALGAPFKPERCSSASSDGSRPMKSL